MDDISKVLIAVDSSDFSAKVAERAIELTSKFKSKVGIVFVVEAIRPSPSAELSYLSEEISTKAKDEAMAIIKQIVKESKIKPEIFIREGNPWEAIISCAKDFKADLIALGTHGRTGVMRLLMGSVAESVIEHSTVPVLIYPSKIFK